MENEELNKLIMERLGERQYKVQRMQEMERRRKSRALMLKRTVYAAAACLVVALMILPLHRTENPLDTLGIDVTSSEIYRSSTPQSRAIAKLIDEGKYAEAQREVEGAIQESDDNISRIRSYCNYDEEAEYMERLEQMDNAELRWLRACILVRTEQYKAAQKELNRYLRKKEFCDHEKEARELLEEIKKLKK